MNGRAKDGLAPRAGALGLGVVAVLAAATAGCETVDRPFQADVRFAPTPAVVGENRAVVALDDPEGDPISEASVRLTPRPSDDGPALETLETTEVEDGRYVADAVEFPEAGAWRVVVNVTLPDGSRHRLEREIRVVSGP